MSRKAGESRSLKNRRGAGELIGAPVCPLGYCPSLGGHRAVKQETTFDSVQMKWEIQEKHRAEADKLGKEEAERRRWQRVLNDPVLGAFVRARAVRTSRRKEETGQ